MPSGVVTDGTNGTNTGTMPIGPPATVPQFPQPQRTSTSQPPEPPADVEMKAEPGAESGPGGGESVPRPHWMKSKLPGVKKLTNKERRRRQNENLRRLLTPKNALMVLNEMMPSEQLANQFKVEPSGGFQANSQYTLKGNHSFCADLTVDGNSYKGYGDNKLMARNAAAEQAIRDLIIKKMSRTVSAAADSPPQDEPDQEDPLPMIQLASFALHKLFSEWEYEGHKVPQLKPSQPPSECGEGGAGSGNGSGESAPPGERPRGPRPPGPPPPRVALTPRLPRVLPTNAPALHPCMLLTYMRPHLEYRELAVEGDRPQNMMFTLGIDADGATYIGKASNKKEARKSAARSACQALFGVVFDERPTATTPLH